VSKNQQQSVFFVKKAGLAVPVETGLTCMDGIYKLIALQYKKTGTTYL